MLHCGDFDNEPWYYWSKALINDVICLAAVIYYDVAYIVIRGLQCQEAASLCNMLCICQHHSGSAVMGPTLAGSPHAHARSVHPVVLNFFPGENGCLSHLNLCLKD